MSFSLTPLFVFYHFYSLSISPFSHWIKFYFFLSLYFLSLYLSSSAPTSLVPSLLQIAWQKINFKLSFLDVSIKKKNLYQEIMAIINDSMLRKKLKLLECSEYQFGWCSWFDIVDYLECYDSRNAFTRVKERQGSILQVLLKLLHTLFNTWVWPGLQVSHPLDKLISTLNGLILIESFYFKLERFQNKTKYFCLHKSKQLSSQHSLISKTSCIWVRTLGNS